MLHEAIRKRKEGGRKKKKKEVVGKEGGEERTKARDESKGRKDVQTVRRHGERGGAVKGTVPRDFRLQVFFHESVPPQPLSIPCYFQGLGEDDSRKKPVAKNLVILSL